MHTEKRILHQRHIPEAANLQTLIANLPTETGPGELSHPPLHTGQTHPLALGLMARHL